MSANGLPVAGPENARSKTPHCSTDGCVAGNGAAPVAPNARAGISAMTRQATDIDPNLIDRLQNIL
jgi:hypothetical protein